MIFSEHNGKEFLFVDRKKSINRPKWAASIKVDNFPFSLGKILEIFFQGLLLLISRSFSQNVVNDVFLPAKKDIINERSWPLNQSFSGDKWATD